MRQYWPGGGPPVEPIQALRPWDSGPQRLGNIGVPAPKRQLLYAPGNSGNPNVPAPEWVAEAHRYARITEVNIAVGLVSALVLNEPVTKRNFLLMRNPNT